MRFGAIYFGAHRELWADFFFQQGAGAAVSSPAKTVGISPFGALRRNPSSRSSAGSPNKPARSGPRIRSGIWDSLFNLDVSFEAPASPSKKK